MEKMTIHRGLAELKLIDSRIQNGIQQITPSGIMQKGKLVDGLYKQEDFEVNIKAKYQSINDLIDRKNKIKSAIVTANSVTKVKVAGVEMTIAEAINHKSVIGYKKELLETLTRKHNVIKGKVLTENEKVDQKANEHANAILGEQASGKSSTDKDIMNIVEPYKERNEYHIVDPLKVETLIEKLKVEVGSFEAEVDAVLSEINAVTIIEF